MKIELIRRHISHYTAAWLSLPVKMHRNKT